MAARNPQERHNVLVDGQHVGHGLVLHEDPWFVLPGNRMVYTVTDAATGGFIGSDASPIKAVRNAYRKLLRHAEAEDRTPSGGIDWEAILERARGAPRAGAEEEERRGEEMNANEREADPDLGCWPDGLEACHG
jgi:hypothetical protein